MQTKLEEIKLKYNILLTKMPVNIYISYFVSWYCGKECCKKGEKACIAPV